MGHPNYEISQKVYSMNSLQIKCFLPKVFGHCILKYQKHVFFSMFFMCSFHPSHSVAMCGIIGLIPFVLSDRQSINIVFDQLMNL